MATRRPGRRRTAAPRPIATDSNIPTSPVTSNDPPQPLAPAGPPVLGSSAAAAVPLTTTRARNPPTRRNPTRNLGRTEDGEFFDISQISEESGEDEATPGRAGPGPSLPSTGAMQAAAVAQTAPNPGTRVGAGVTPLPVASTTIPNAGGTATQTSRPLVTGGRSNAPPTSADVHHFFKKSKQEDTVCKVCQ